jgi:hypothetical protein
LKTVSSVIKEALKSGKVKLQAGVYDLATGKVTMR